MMGLTNTAATIPGMVSPLVVGALIQYGVSCVLYLLAIDKDCFCVDLYQPKRIICTSKARNLINLEEFFRTSFFLK